MRDGHAGWSRAFGEAWDRFERGRRAMPMVAVVRAGRHAGARWSLGVLTPGEVLPQTLVRHPDLAAEFRVREQVLDADGLTVIVEEVE